MGITQKLNLACGRGHVYFLNFIVVYQIWTICNKRSVVKELSPLNWSFTMLLQVIKMSKTLQIPETTAVSSSCVTLVMQSRSGNGVSWFQWVSGWLPSQSLKRKAYEMRCMPTRGPQTMSTDVSCYAKGMSQASVGDSDRDASEQLEMTLVTGLRTVACRSLTDCQQ